MDNSYLHSGTINYNLSVLLQNNVLELSLSIRQGRRVRNYKDFLINDSLQTKLKKEAKTVENLFAILEKKWNFMVDPLKGGIVVLLRKIELNEEKEKEIEIMLKFVGEEQKEEIMESRGETSVKSIASRVSDKVVDWVGDEWKTMNHNVVIVDFFEDCSMVPAIINLNQ